MKNTIVCFLLFLVVFYVRGETINEGPNQQSNDSPNVRSSSSGSNRGRQLGSSGQGNNRNNEYTSRPAEQSSELLIDNSERQLNERPNQYRPSGGSNQFSNNREDEYNQRPNQRPSGGSNQFSSNREDEYNQRPNQRPSGGSNQFSSNREDEYNQRPNQRPSGGSNQFSNNREDEYNQRPNRRPSGGSNQFSNNREDEYNQRPNRRPSGGSNQFSNNREDEYNQRPNQRPSGGSNQFSNNREDEYNQRPNQRPSGGSNQFSNNREDEYNQRPNRRPSGGSNQFSNIREDEYNQRPNRRPSGGSNQFSNNREDEYNQRPNQRPSGGSNQFSSNREDEYNQRPNQRPSGGSNQFSNNREDEYNQRPNQRPSGGSNQFSNNREDEYNQRPNQQYGQSGNGHRPSQQSSSGNPNKPNKRPSSFGQSGNLNQQTSQSQPNSSGSKQLCYRVFGCFSTEEPWTSKLRPVPGPLPPENNSATIYFYSRPNIDQRYLISVYPEFSMGDAKFNPRRPTAIIIHGFIQDGNEAWEEAMKDAYLNHVDANVMIVDWGKGSRTLSYLQASGNTRLIGVMIAYLIKRLMESYGANPGKFHLIGHSLGAQVAAYAAKEVPGIGRLTALDPAQPGFEGFDKRVRLDKSDAEFVDVIHTNAKPFIPFLGLGMIKPHGHVDFYMNGGFDQPLCVAPPANDLKKINSIADLANLPVDWFSQTITCDHARAHSYLTEAFSNTDCIFWGHKANVKNVAQGVANTLTQGLLSKYVALSTNCSTDDCVPMGFKTKDSPLRGTFIVTTNGKSPYCRSEPGVP